MQGVAPFSYKGFQVLSWIPDGIQGQSGRWETPLERLDVPSGAFAITAPALHPVHGRKVVYKCVSRDADHAPLATFLAGLLGRLTPFWCPTFQRDMDIISSPLGSFTIETVGYARLFAADPIGSKYLYAFNQNGANAATALATAAVDNGDGTETITYSTSAGDVGGGGEPVLTTADGISLLRFSRLGDDAITHRFFTTDLVDVELAIASILNEQP